MATPIPQRVLRELPKIELHLHLDGAVRTETLFELGQRSGHPLPGNTPEELARYVQVGPDCRSLREFLDTFEVFYPVLRSPYALERIAYELCEDKASERVIYFETRFAPALQATSSFSQEEAVRAVIRGLEAGSRDFGVRAGLILCCMRSADLDSCRETGRLAAKYMGRGVSGLDLAGDESRPASRLRDVFTRAHEAEIPITIHAGEAGPPENVAQALDELHARRIGHGIACRYSDPLRKRLRKERVPLEICPTSNLQTGAVASIADHPVDRFHEEGMLVTVNTDDPQVSGSIDLNWEYRLLVEKKGFTALDLRRVTENAARAAFVDPDTKTDLLCAIDAAYPEEDEDHG